MPETIIHNQLEIRLWPQKHKRTLKDKAHDNRFRKNLYKTIILPKMVDEDQLQVERGEILGELFLGDYCGVEYCPTCCLQPKQENENLYYKLLNFILSLLE